MKKRGNEEECQKRFECLHLKFENQKFCEFIKLGKLNFIKSYYSLRDLWLKKQLISLKKFFSSELFVGVTKE